MAPSADFSCLSKKCETDGCAPVYELPVGSTRCPKCGSKRIKQLFNKIAVLRGAQQDRDPRLTSNSHAARSGALLRSGFDYHDAHKPGYTPPVDPDGYRVADPRRYDRLESVAVSPQEAAAILTPGKGKPLTPMEIMREKRQDPYGVVAGLAAVSGRPVPTVIAGKDEDPK